MQGQDSKSANPEKRPQLPELYLQKTIGILEEGRMFEGGYG
jgi:hypothetical protein